VKKTTVLFAVLFIFFFSRADAQISSYSFTATTGVYTPITGTTPFLVGDGTNPLKDEAYGYGIPIGFTFIYLGNLYTSMSASTNGFAAFGNIGTTAFSNNLASNIVGKPILAPLWEDLSLSAPTDLKYTTTGSAGSRIFTVQWDNVFFDFGAGAAALAFQVRLYETTNVIEFIYKQLPGTVQDFSGGASIGITGGGAGSGNFLSLSDCSSSPLVSSSVVTNNIMTKPATGQVYRFAPAACSPPGVAVSNLTATSATISWTPGSPLYEYAVTTSSTPPVSGTVGGDVSAPANNLIPCTQYFLYVRKSCGGNTWSGWSSTACRSIA